MAFLKKKLQIIGQTIVHIPRLTSTVSSGDEERPAPAPLSVAVSETKGHVFHEVELC